MFALVFYIDRRSATLRRGQVKYQRFEYELIDSQNLSTSQIFSFREHLSRRILSICSI